MACPVPSRTITNRIMGIPGRIAARLEARGDSLLFPLTLLALFFGFLSGVRAPNLWAATHLLFDYSDGFIKRGLSGEVLTIFFGHTVSYRTLVALSFGIFAVWVLLLLLRLRAVATFDRAIWIVAAVVFVSPGFVFLVHEIGYLDHVGLVVVLLCFLMPANAAGLAGRLLLCGAMIVTHEAFFLMFFPVVVLDFAVRATMIGYRFRTAGAILLVAVTAAATYTMGQLTPRAENESAYVEYLDNRASDFPVRRDTVTVLFRNARDNLTVNWEVWRQPSQWLAAVAAAAFLLPLAIALILIGCLMVYRTSLPDRTKTVLCVGVVVSGLSPLLLNVVAWDVWRFVALTQVSAFLALLAVGQNLRTAIVPRPWSQSAIYALVILAVLGAATSPPLFDEYTPVKPPFLAHVIHLKNALTGEVHWLPIPSK